MSAKKSLPLPAETPRPALVYPGSGATGVSPYTDIVISIPMGGDWKEDLLVRVNGQELVRGNQCAKGFKVARVWEQGGRICLAIHKRGGWSAQHNLVQISAGAQGRSCNQHFFLKDSVVAPEGVGTNAWRHVPGGYFWLEQGGWYLAGKRYPVPDYLPLTGQIIGDGCVWYREAGMVAWLDAQGRFHSHPIPPRIFLGALQVQMQAEGDDFTLVAIDGSGAIMMMRRDLLHMWNHAKAVQVGLTKGWIHANVAGASRSWHLPVQQVPAALDETLDYWWPLEVEDVVQRSWRMLWADGLHAWHTNRVLIAHTNPNPVSGTSETILWTSADIGEDLLDVQMIGGNHVLINNRVIANLAMPHVTRLS